MLRIIAQLVLFIPRELLQFIETFVRHWPGTTGFWIRRLYYRLRLKHVGRHVLISPGVRFFGHRHISIGDNTHIDLDCIILAGPARLDQHEVRRISNTFFTLQEGEVSIGKGVHIAPGCLIVGHGGVQIGDFCGCTTGTRIFSVTAHYAGFEDRSRRVLFTAGIAGRRACIVGPVVLQENAGVAVQSVLLPGTTLRTDSFLAIGSVARGEIPPNKIAAGNPATPVRDRFLARTTPIE